MDASYSLRVRCEVHRRRGQCGSFPDLPALTGGIGPGAGTLTWRELRIEVSALTHGLASLVHCGERMLIMMSKRPGHWIVDLAAAHLGALSCTVYDTLSTEQIRFVARHSAATVVVLEGMGQLDRSRAMVERILDAGQQVLIEHGYDGTSTNRIAQAAGISPGSLYQYFPNKDAIMSAVVDRFNESLASRVAGHMSDQFDQPPAVVIRTTLAELLDALDVHPELQRAAIEHAPRLDDGRQLREFERRIGDLATAYLSARRDTLRTSVPVSATAWMVVRTVEHLTARYLLDRPALTRDQFLDELTRLTLSYLGLTPQREQNASGQGA